MQPTTRKNQSGGIDALLFAFPILLSCLGLVALYSAGFAEQSTRKLLVQIASALLGIGLMWAMSKLDYRAIKSYTRPLYVACVSALVLVLVFGIGKQSVGANSWIRFFGIGIQPSEPIKVAFSYLLASRLTRENGRDFSVKTLVGKLFPLVLLVGLVILQNDTGTAFVYLFMLAFAAFAAGVPIKYFAVLTAGFLLFSPLLWHILADYQKERILVFLNPARDPQGAGYQVLQARLSLGSGGLFGKGFLNGPRTQLALIPEKDTDFIFAVIGEEFGFLGCALVVLLLFLFLAKCMAVFQNAKDDFARLTAISIFAMFFSHITENIGMCIGLLPVTGIPLPFFSYGGSSLVTCFLAVGVLLSIDKTSKKSYDS